MKLLLPFHLNKVGAGFPSPATDYIEDDLDLNAHLIKNIPSTFLIRVQGKSMNKVGIHNDDLLVVDRSLNPKNFSTVVANINEELVVKTFLKEKKSLVFPANVLSKSNRLTEICLSNCCFNPDLAWLSVGTFRKQDAFRSFTQMAVRHNSQESSMHFTLSDEQKNSTKQKIFQHRMLNCTFVK